MKKIIFFLLVCSMILTSRAQVLTPNRTSICKGDSVNFIVSGVNNTDTVVIYSETNDGAYFDTIIGNTVGYSPNVTTVYTLFSVNDSVMFTPTICIQVHDLPIVSLYTERIACNTFAIYYDLLHGTLPVTYFWDNGVVNTTNTINGGDTACLCLIDYNGCMVVQSITAPVDTLVTIDSIWSTPETCNLGSAGISATGGQITYTWDDSSHAQTRDLCHGTYHVMASNQLGCIADTSIIIDFIQNPTAIIPTFMPIENYGDTTIISVLAINGIPPYTYSWSNGSTDSILVVGAGIYSCVVTDANGCTDTVSVNLTQPDSLAVTVIIPTIQCTDNHASIIPNISGGVPPYTYTIDGQEVTIPIYVSHSGNYSFMVTDAHGNFDTTTLSIQFPTQVTIDSILSTPETCNLGSAGIFASGGQISYTWDDSSHVQIRHLSHGTYHVVASNENGCTADTNITIGIVQNLQAIIPAYNPITSYGETTSISVITMYGTAPYTYLWNNGSIQQTQYVGAGSYYCIVTDVNGCTDTTLTVDITQPSNLFVNVEVPIIHCSDQTVEITPFVSGGVAPYTYLWNGVSIIPPILVTTSGNYSLIVTDATGNSQTLSVPVQFPTPITATITPSATQINAGMQVVLTGCQAAEYVWSTGETTQTIIVTPSETTTYYLFVRNSSGCTDQTMITITVVGSGDNPGGGGSTTGNQITFELGDLHDVCWNSDPIVLQSYVSFIEYNGGQVNFTGPGVAGGVFYPSSVGMSGTYQIIASYYDPVNHTTSEATQSVTVHPSTTLDWQLSQSVVGLYDDPIHLTGGIPSGGSYSGNGVVQQGNEYIFYPSTAGVGTHMLFYEYVNSWGCYSNTSKVITVVNSASVSNFEMSVIQVYPNPTTNNVILDLSGYTCDVVLFDMLGRTLSSFQNLTGSTEINLSQLSAGVYFLRCTSESGDIVTKKVIKK